jgi:organic radical activating enzyme
MLHSGDYHLKRKLGFPTEKEIELFLNNLEEKYLKGRKLNVQLSGGEPTLHPMITFITQRLKEHNGYIGITTNGSKSIEFWKQILPIGNVTISLHPEYTKIDKINKLSRVIVDSGTKIDYNLSGDPKNWDRVMDLYDQLDDEFKPFVNPKVLNHIDLDGSIDRRNYEYEPYQEEWMRDKTKNQKRRSNFVEITPSHLLFSDGTRLNTKSLAEITLNNWHNMKGWICNVGSESINIHYSGYVFAGVCKVKKLGRIDDFNLLSETVICPKERCICPADLRSNKRNIH